MPYQIVARPLLKVLEPATRYVKFEVLRPPTFKALRQKIEKAREDGEPYHILHFDGHRAVPRCTKDLIEEYLFARRRDLFSTLELVFFDTTSIYFEGRGGETIGRRGHSKDHRPDCPQMVVGAVLDGEGRPVCCEIWPGNTADLRAHCSPSWVAQALCHRAGMHRGGSGHDKLRDDRTA